VIEVGKHIVPLRFREDYSDNFGKEEEWKGKTLKIS
jgi:hypothetical protein